jgi:hypothetical protein
MMPLKSVLLLALALLFLLGGYASGKEPDRDRDGLPDYREIHKYGTDPRKRDTDGDGKPDGDWDERREYAYTVRSVVRVLRPCRPEVMNDDYQDARVREETDRWVEVEVVHYPFNTNAEAIEGSRDWRRAARRLREFLEAGLVTNWDRALRETLFAELRERGVDPEKTTDRELVERTARWLLDRAKYTYRFGTYFVHFPDGKPAIYPGLEEAFRRERGNTEFPLEEHWQHELFGKGMFDNRSYGTCTSTAIYLTTGLRALGIPTRMVLAIPFVDPSDPEQLAMVREGITNNAVRAELLTRLRGLGKGFTAHTFNEVYVGGRWRRLNYRTLGQNIYGAGAMGMLTHVHTFDELSEAGLTVTWGVRYGKGERDEDFPHANPYRALAVSDEFGEHCGLENPEVPVPELPTEARITKAYWFHSEHRPAWISADAVRDDGSGHLLVHVAGSLKDLKAIYPDLGREFRLLAEGKDAVRAFAERGHWNQECYVRIPPEEYRKMEPGVTYRLVPVNPDTGPRWTVEEGVTIVPAR